MLTLSCDAVVRCGDAAADSLRKNQNTPDAHSALHQFRIAAQVCLRSEQAAVLIAGASL